eukprot:g5482.t1
MIRHQWGSCALPALLLGVLMLISFSVCAGDEVDVRIGTAVERGSIDVGGTTVSFLGNLGSTPSASEPGVARNVLLLHGAKYSAQTWENLGTLAMLADAGFRVAAVDLPTSKMNRPRDETLELICRGLGMAEDSPAAIVSPSMSGTFSVNLLLRKPELFAAYVPVAPGQVLSYPAQAFAAIDVPALIIYGEMDKMGAKVSSLLQAIPSSHVLMIPAASHSCYLDEPELFHHRLLNFLQFDAVFSPPQRRLSDPVR